MSALIMFASACATIPRQTSEVPLNVHLPKADRAALTNINTAPPQELEKLPGIGKVIAARIVAHREQYGDFRRTEHLMMVRGISDRKFRAIRDLLAVD